MTKLAVALDHPECDFNLDLVRQFVEQGIADQLSLKIGLNTFIAGGPEFVKKVKSLTNSEIVLDLKLHDIPNTMKEAVSRMHDLGVDIITVHASAGEHGMSAARRAAIHNKTPIKVLAVTALTSIMHDECELIYGDSIKRATRRFVEMAALEELDGVVIAAKFLPSVDKWLRDGLNGMIAFPTNFIRFVPGIRFPDFTTLDDQNQKSDLATAIMGGATYVVIGRPIYQNPKPLDTTKIILGKIEAINKHISEIEKENQWLKSP